MTTEGVEYRTHEVERGETNVILFPASTLRWKVFGGGDSGAASRRGISRPKEMRIFPKGSGLFKTTGSRKRSIILMREGTPPPHGKGSAERGDKDPWDPDFPPSAA